MVLPDSRLMDMPRRDLWAARVPGQVFVVEQHSKPISDGPGLAFSGLIPDFDHFKGSGGGRVLPFLHPDGSENLAAGLVDLLSARLQRDVTPTDVLAYVAAVVAHPEYTATFTDELTTPGIRVPITDDPVLWDRAVGLGAEVVWLHTYGAAFTSPARPAGNVRYPAGDSRQPRAMTPIRTMPGTIHYAPDRAILTVGDGEFAPVRDTVWSYTVGGKSVVKSWVNYRKLDPGGRRSSPLDEVHPTTWDPDWTLELIDLLTVLTRLDDLAEDQGALLAEILAGSVLDRADMKDSGVVWPTAKVSPRYSLDAVSQADTPHQPTLEL